MATGGLYGSTSTGTVAPQSGSESVGLYGNNTVFGGTYFEWFIFKEASTQPTTPTGGSWNFTTNVGTAPTGWSSVPPAVPSNQVWVSIGVVNSRSTAAIIWSAPGLFTFNSGTVTNVSALTLGTTGTDVSSTVANPTTTPVITLNLPTASATNRGLLSSTDWAAFNAKAPSGTYVTSVTGTTGRITSTGGLTPVIDLASGVATAGTTGSSTLIPVVTIDTYGRVTGITTAANPQGSVTSVAASVPSFLSISGSPITSSGTLAIGYSGTALPVANGGTGALTLTGYVYGNGTGAMTAATTIPTTVLSGTVTNAQLNNSSITINGNVVSLGGSTTITAATISTLTIGTGLSGTSFNGSIPVTIALASGYGDTLNPYASKTANYVLAAPNGTAGVPTFRAIVPADIPTLNQNTTGTAANVTGVVAVANGGSGVTVSSGANSIVLRDANSNITVNSINESFSSVSAAGTTTVLTASSAPNYVVTGSGGQTYQLPDATTLANGINYTFNNNQSSGTIVVKNNSSTTVATIQSGGFVEVILLSNATAAGSWDVHNFAPSNVSWSTNTFDYPGSITSATWNGTAVAINRGGTGQTTAAAAITALAGTQTSGYYLRSNGTNTLLAAIVASDVPTLNQNTTGTAANITATSNSTLTTLSALSLPGSQVSGNISGNAANVTGTVAIGNGGTGQTTASAAFNALSPITTTGDLVIGNGTNSATRLGIGANGYVLTSNGTTATWAAATGGVSQIVAGTNVTISPAGGTGVVTINSTGGGGGGSAYTRTTFTATAGQTAFTVTYAVGYLQIYVNGVLLTGSDYTATSGTNFTLNVACIAGDVVEALVITTSITGITTGKSIAMAMIFGY